jgi:DNA-binding NarL/FixJ family response regulator
MILLEWELPGQPAEDLLEALSNSNHGTRLIVLGRHPETEQEALAAGAHAFVSKAGAPQKLLAALRGFETA